MKSTTNYGLKKPETNDAFDKSNDNENMDIIDTQMKANSDAVVAAKAYVDAEIADITPAGIGAETPTGAQTKVDTHVNDAIGAHAASSISVGDSAGNFASSDVEGALAELFTSVSDGKSAVASAITDMGQSASGSDTFSQLAVAIGNISDDANAAVGNVLTGKTFYQGGAKKTGTMPNNTAPTATITTQGGTKVVPAGYSPGGTVTASFANLSAANVKSGVNIGGVVGTLAPLTNEKKWASGSATATWASNILSLSVSGLTFTPAYVMAYTNAREFYGICTGGRNLFMRMNLYTSYNFGDGTFGYITIVQDIPYTPTYGTFTVRLVLSVSSKTGSLDVNWIAIE